VNPVALLALGVALHYGWAAFPAEHQAQAWNVLGALTRAALLLALVWHVRNRWALLVAAWWLAEEAMVVGCSLAFMFSPWVVAPGEAQCSALLQFDIGRVGLACIALLLMLRKT
jgi:hypothetical protein